jgi:hypothetical protein
MKMHTCRIRKAAALLTAVTGLLASSGCGWFHRDNPQETADTFFQLLSSGKTREAYDSTAFTFQAGQTFNGFEQTTHELGIADYSAITWTRRVPKNPKETSLEGEITRKDGSKVPVAITLVKQAGQWKLYALHISGKNGPAPTKNPFTLVGKGPEFNDVYTSHPVPSQPEVVELSRGALLKLNDAIKRRDFKELFNSLSDKWRNQIGLSLRRLERTYQPFIDAGVTLDGVASVEPVFTDPPQVNSEGLLIVTGYFPTQPYRVNFSLEFNYEMPDWKLFGLDVSLVQ